MSKKEKRKKNKLMNLIKDLVLLEVDTNEINQLDGLNQEVIELIRII